MSVYKLEHFTYPVDSDIRVLLDFMCAFCSHKLQKIVATHISVLEYSDLYGV